MKKAICFVFMMMLPALVFSVGTSGVTAGSQIINGTDTGTVGEPDMAGDMLIKFAQDTGLGTLTDTATQSLIASVGRTYGAGLDDPGNKVGAPGAELWYLYSIENKGNASDVFSLSLGTPVYTGSPGNPWTFQIWNQGKINQISTITVAEDGIGQFYVKVIISTNAQNGATGAVEVKGTTTNDGPSYTVGNWTYGGADSVSDWGTSSIAAAIMKVSKSLTYGTPSGYTGSNQFVPGGTITYTITYWNEGAGTATNVSVSDRIPNYTEYAAGSLKMNGVSKTDANDGDGATYDNGLITFTIGTVPAGGSGNLSFEVRIY
ncbi:MAG: hypothetical protein AB1630_05180 [bacterium]